MTLGQKIVESRKKKRIRAAEIAAHIGKSPAAMSDIENDRQKGGPDPETLIKIADFLEDNSILVFALLDNPISKRVIPRAFKPLNNIKTDPLAILAKLLEETEEMVDAIKILIRNFSHAEPESMPNFRAVLLNKLEQIVDVPRGIEELFCWLKAYEILSEAEHLEIYMRQQAKVEAHGHHKGAA